MYPLHFRFLFVAIATGAALSMAGSASADLVQLTTVVNPGAYDDLERAAAAANQSVFDALVGPCGGGECPADQQAVFDEARELVDTAADILGTGTGQFSLGLDDEGLGNALRWTAAEEVLAQGRAATDFSNGQMTGATNRITALRYGARGFSIAGIQGMPTSDLPDFPEHATLGAAGEEGGGETLAKFGGFLNGSYGWGVHDPTTFEDAFDYESVDITLGFDYRVLPGFVVGLIGGYAENEIDFDGSKSIVDGGINSDGFSIGAFGVYSWSDFYLSGYFSYQRMSFDIDRFITYPSLNPDVTGTNTTTSGETDSNAYNMAANFGYTYRFGLSEEGFFSGKPLLLEPSMRLEYSQITIDSFTETNDDPGEYFALAIDEQDIESFEVVLGLRTSAAVSTSIGVFFPYVRVEWRFDVLDDTGESQAQYGGIGLSGVAGFSLPGDDVDSDYGTVAIGLQTIIRGGQSRILGGPTGDRLSIYGEYRRVLELDNVESEILTAGARYIF